MLSGFGEEYYEELFISNQKRAPENLSVCLINDKVACKIILFLSASNFASTYKSIWFITIVLCYMYCFYVSLARIRIFFRSIKMTV